MDNQKTGCLFIICAPSGAGKTSLVKEILKAGLNLNLSVSHTTRTPRAQEVNGKDYHFVSHDTFKRMLVNGEFLESAEVYGHLYGTSQTWINSAVASGRDILLEIDCQGAKQVRQIFPQAIGIFILPPSMNTLEMRLRSRAQDSSDVIQKRLNAAREEVSHINEFDYVIVNNLLPEALDNLMSIVKAERLRKERQLIRHQSLITQLT